MSRTMLTMALGLALFAVGPGTLAKDHPAGPEANVGVIACTTMPSMPISYFKAGSTLDQPPSGSQSSGAGAGSAAYTSTLEIHAPLGSASDWHQALDHGYRIGSCTLGISGIKGTQTLSFSNLVVTSVTVYGKRGDDSPLSSYFTDVVLVIVPAPTGSPVPGGWDISGSKSN